MKVVVGDDAGGALELMESVLRQGGELAADYPLVFGAQKRGKIVAVNEADRVLSACALLEQELVQPGGRVRIGMIGSVATAPDARGRGLASAVLERAEKELRVSGCLLSLLWADSPEFYTRRGYSAIGAERDFVLEIELADRLPVTCETRAASESDHGRLHELYSSQELRVERLRSESAQLYQAPGMKVLVAEAGGRVIGYVCLGRGADLAGVVHEWAGSPEGVLNCLGSLLRACRNSAESGPLFLMSPGRSTPVSAALEGLGARSAMGSLGMGKLLNPGEAAATVARAADRPIDWSWGPGGECVLRAGTRSMELTSEDLISALFPARGERSIIEAIENGLEASLESLPCKAFLWGLDSI
jgi:N-acetylglutamate synthase-like GNAT family acetyltransferase